MRIGSRDEEGAVNTYVKVEDDEDDTVDAAVVRETRVHREIIFVTLSVFAGYGILVSFQHQLKKKMHIADSDKTRSEVFTASVSCLYLGNLIFRLAHNFVFGCFSPRSRVYISMVCMMLSMTAILSIFVLHLETLALVAAAYLLGGVAIGSFESNLLSAITPLGPHTKVWAIVGLPGGFACILVGGFLLLAVGVPPAAMYLVVLLALAVGIVVFRLYIPDYVIAGNAVDLPTFLRQMRAFRRWVPRIWRNCVALALDMFCVSLFSGLMLYLLNGPRVSLLGQDDATLTAPHDWFFAAYNLFTLAGDSISRRLVYSLKPRNPFVYLTASAVGFALCLSRIGLLAPVGIFLIFFANGAIYGTSTRFIDNHVDGEFSLAATSFWLFVGDIGSVVGSNVLSIIRNWFCFEPHRFVCVATAAPVIANATLSLATGGVL